MHDRNRPYPVSNRSSDLLRAMTWLANDCRAAGIGLRAGQLHNTGSCTAMYVAEPGDLAEARFAGLGEVRIRF